MTQFILDDQLFLDDVLFPIARWRPARYIHTVRPNEVVKDERIPMILRELRQPTFVTIDMWFWNRSLCDRRYCILCFPLSNEQQPLIPGLLRHVLRLPEFSSRAARMGKVARIRHVGIDYWQVGSDQEQHVNWSDTRV